MEREAGDSAKMLSHRKPLMVLNKGHVLQVREGFAPQHPQLKVAILGEVDTEDF